MSAHMPGPGDGETWPAPTGHSNDPRTDTSYDDECPICYEPLGTCEHVTEAPEPDFEAMQGDMQRWP